MIHKAMIGGKEVELAWTQDIANRFPFRCSKIGVDPSQLFKEFSMPRKAAAAFTSFLWLILPPNAHGLYQSPEDLFVAIDHESEAASIHAAVLGVIADMSPDAEKKSTLNKSHSPESNSD
jgi:hypothetical protein